METIIIDGMSYALPLFIIAIAGIYSEKSGVINLALEGLLGFGAFIGALFVVLISRDTISANSGLLPYMALAFAMLGGMIYSMLYGLLTIKFKANQVISGVVINILSMSLTLFLTKQINRTVFENPSDNFKLAIFKKFSLPVLSDIPIIGAFFSKIYPFQVIILVVAVLAYYVLYKTKYGMRLRASGENPYAVDACGVDVGKTRFFAIMISGALAGLGGMSFAYSISSGFTPNIYFGAGYLAIAALIFGNWNIVPTFIACIIFGFTRSGGFVLSQKLNLAGEYSDLIMILPYLVTLVLLVFFSKKNRAPKALGEIYDKSKR